MTATYSADHLSFTFPNISQLVDIKEHLRALGLEFKPRAWGRHFYRQSLAAWGDDITIHWNEERPEMGVHVDISGGGCRILEELGTKLHELAGWAAAHAAKFTRIDIALDTSEVHISTVRAAAEANQIKGHVQSYDRIVQSSPAKGAGTTVYFGSAASQRMLRVYDKAAEQKITDGTVWTRFEWQFRAVKADMMGRLFALGDWSQVLAACKDFVQFTSPESSADSNRSRHKEASWFTSLLSMERLRLRVSQATSDLVTRSMAWIDRQWLPTLNALVQADRLYELLQKAQTAQSRMSDKHHLLKESLLALTNPTANHPYAPA